MTSPAASGRRLSRFEKRRKIPLPTALFTLSIMQRCIMQCQRRLQIYRVKNIATFEIKAAWHFAHPTLWWASCYFLKLTCPEKTVKWYNTQQQELQNYEHMLHNGPKGPCLLDHNKKVGQGETTRRLIRKRSRNYSLEKFEDAFDAAVHLSLAVYRTISEL